MNYRKCNNCGNQVNNDDNICQYCGNHLYQNISNINNQENEIKQKKVPNFLKIGIYMIIGFVLGITPFLLKEIKQLNKNNQENNNIVEDIEKEDKVDNVIDNQQDEEIINDEQEKDTDIKEEIPKEEQKQDNKINKNENSSSNNSNSSNNNITSSNNTTNSNNNSTDDCKDCLKYVEIGNYVGMNIFDAITECENKGIDVKVQMSYSDGFEEYTVIEQNGEPGGKYIKDVGLVLKLTVQSKYKMGNVAKVEMEEEMTKDIEYISISTSEPKVISIDKKNRIIKYGYFIDYEIQFIKNENTERKEKTYILELYDSNNNKIIEDTINTYVEKGETKNIKDKIDITNKIKNNENYIIKIR